MATRYPNFDPSRICKADADGSSSDSDLDDDIPDDSEFAPPRKRRRTGNNAKERAALGVFASDSEDEERKHKSRFKGVSFVSSAAKTGSDSEGDGYDDMADGKMDSNTKITDGEKDASVWGLDFRGAAIVGSLGLEAAQLGKRGERSVAASSGKGYDQQAPLGKGFVPTSEQGPILNVRDDEPKARKPMPSAFEHAGGKIRLTGKGFGARMLAKMGYQEGQGLGKENQGRSAALEANLARVGLKKVGLGVVKEQTEAERQEQKRQAKLRGEVVDSVEDSIQDTKTARMKRHSGHVGTPKREKARYMTWNDVKKAAPGLHIPDAFTTILDMTGPEKKLLTTAGLMTPTKESAPAAECRKLARRAQNELMAILEECQSLQERKAYVNLQAEEEGQQLEELLIRLETEKSVLAACESLTEPVESGELDKKSDLAFKIKRVVLGLRDAGIGRAGTGLVAESDDLATLAVAVINPLFKEWVQLWDPLEEPSPGFLDRLLEIRDLLGSRPTQKKAATPFATMMYKWWLPRAQIAVREWKVGDPDRMIAIVDAWKKLLPPFIRAQLLGDIARRLEEAVRLWEPRRKKSQLPHLWIFPWLAYLPDYHLDPKSSGIVGDVRRKFRQLIEVWDFSRGVIPGLDRWKNVLRPSRAPDHWAPLVMNHLLPSMTRYLHSHFKVDPQDQEATLSVLEGALSWSEVISSSMMANTIVSAVFPQFHDILHQWLMLEKADMDEVNTWLAWWKQEVFPAEISNCLSIRAEFEKADALIAQASDLEANGRPKTELKRPETGPALKKSEGGKRLKREQPPAVTAKPVELTFRQLVEDWCQENDLHFIPERTRVHAEGPLYRITARGDGKGGVLGYFKGDTLVIEQRNRAPVEIRRDKAEHLDSLLDLAG